MKRRLGWLALAALGVALLVAAPGSRTTAPEGEWHALQAGPLTVWAVYEGQIASRTVHTVVSRLNGSAHITLLAEEGVRVQAGEIIARFDDAALRRDTLRLERDVTVAEAEVDSLRRATHPLKIRSLDVACEEAQALHDSEAEFLEESRSLVADGLLSAAELRQQESAVQQARVKLEGLREQRRLTHEILHPAERRHAEARLESARQELEMARAQLEACAVAAPSEGVVVHLPTHLGSEYRTVRVGDEVFNNQPFLAVHDMDDLLVRCQVPETDVARIQSGSQTEVIPLAYQDLRLAGVVERVSSMARNLAGRPAWQRYFEVEVGLRDNDPRLRTGMSVQANILSFHADAVLRIPRTAVWWEAGTPYCNVREGRHVRRRQLALGLADDQHYEVRGGLEAGALVARD